MSQSGTKTQMVFMNWTRGAFQRTESKARYRHYTHDEVYPKTPGVRSIEAGTSNEPFRAESHPAARAPMRRFQIRVER